jgi:hypothetical protein
MKSFAYSFLLAVAGSSESARRRLGDSKCDKKNEYGLLKDVLQVF